MDSAAFDRLIGGIGDSALQRARAVVAQRVPARSQQDSLRELGDVRLRALVDGYVSALERRDIDAPVGLLTADVTWSMPPLPHWYRGLDTVGEFALAVPMTCGGWRHLITGANGQPAAACYLRAPGTDRHSAWSVNVFAVRDGRIAAITSFIGPEHFALLGLPSELPVLRNSQP